MPLQPIYNINEVRLTQDVDTGAKYLNQYRLIEKIGSGHNGKVYLASEIVKDTEPQVEKLYAIKELSKVSKISILNKDPAARINNIRNEVDIMRLIQDNNTSHPNIVRFHQLLDDPNSSRVFLVFEYCDGHHLKFGATVPYTIERIHHILVNVVLGLEYLHGLGVLHRDIKPSNILHSGELFKEVKITDFGSSCMKFNNNQSTTGTPAFMAPELFDSSHLHHNHHENNIDTQIDGTEADIWALGVSLYSLYYRKLPFSGHNEFNLFNIVVYQEPDYETEMPLPRGDADDLLVDLIKSMLIKDPRKRIRLCDVKSHAFIKKLYSSSEYKQFVKFNEGYLFKHEQLSRASSLSQKFKRLFKRKASSSSSGSESNSNSQPPPRKLISTEPVSSSFNSKPSINLSLTRNTKSAYNNSSPVSSHFETSSSSSSSTEAFSPPRPSPTLSLFNQSIHSTARSQSQSPVPVDLNLSTLKSNEPTPAAAANTIIPVGKSSSSNERQTGINMPQSSNSLDLSAYLKNPKLDIIPDTLDDRTQRNNSDGTTESDDGSDDDQPFHIGVRPSTATVYAEARRRLTNDSGLNTAMSTRANNSFRF
ncbi:hypothetical protein WICPIJ_005480 [Wickerhamomyces pijperi]|uniref:non-specific serine/threonine protein kinase n=1 Tax=Wickerhamomyces pijperi TaxID=599730 RepID=A0A9P8TL31_WICPI|nr:hypothetical protein WICPIJ_005480 [Wickerhamomyces pijperi]